MNSVTLRGFIDSLLSDLGERLGSETVVIGSSAASREVVAVFPAHTVTILFDLIS